MSGRLRHPILGECELVRIEGVNWIVRECTSRALHRISPSRRTEFLLVLPTTSPLPVTTVITPREVAPLSKSLASSPTAETYSQDSADSELLPNANQGAATRDSSELPLPADQETFGQIAALSAVVPRRHEDSGSIPLNHEARLLRRAFDSLRTGLSPTTVGFRQLAVGIAPIEQRVQNLLDDVAKDGGRSVVLRGAYGQGKTFCLDVLKQMALESGYLVASTEIDAFENQLQKPDRIYRSLMKNLRIPGNVPQGVRGLAQFAHAFLFKKSIKGTDDSRNADTVRRMLMSEIQCKPLAWLLSDPNLMKKPLLLDLLACEPGIPLAAARRSHSIHGLPRDWPAFNAGTQGDFASYVLSGIGRLSRLLGFQGLVIVLDEMEKWQDLDWKTQSKAGNLLGGLIWGASAEDGKRNCKKPAHDCDHSNSLRHSWRNHGYPFSTVDRCFLGLAIAMTPRDEDSPEVKWSNFGLLEVVDLPRFEAVQLEEYCQRVFPLYCKANDIDASLPHQISDEALQRWRNRGDGSTRSAVQSVVEAFDAWRDSSIA